MPDVRSNATQNVSVYDEAGNALAGTTGVYVDVRKVPAKVGTPTSITTTTQTTVHDPAAGKAVRLKWIGLKTPAGAADTIVTVRLGSTIIYQWPMTALDVFTHTTTREGAVDENLTVQCSVASNVYVNLDVEEF